jgi:4,5-DOPA dioxygenase extradiol
MTILTPAVFVGHGSPMNALEHNRYTEAWHDIGRALGTPRAILVVSAHWYTDGSFVTAMENPRTIHDFGGFPDELFAMQYPAPGDPQLADNLIELAKPCAVSPDVSWGLDHGTWSVLTHMFPDASIPVLQLSIDANKTVDEHLALAAQLAPLREQGVAIVASGNVVHNLRRLQWDTPEGAAEWAQEFDNDAEEIMTRNPADILRLPDHRQYAKAAPTPDHLIPLYYIAGLAVAAAAVTETFNKGYAMGSLSMTSYILR